MKRYMVFYHPAYYPLGGMEDFIGSFDDLNVAIIAMHNEHSKGKSITGAYGGVYDLQKCAAIAHYRSPDCIQPLKQFDYV
jgi:hypothetical protein